MAALGPEASSLHPAAWVALGLAMGGLATTAAELGGPQGETAWRITGTEPACAEVQPPAGELEVFLLTLAPNRALLSFVGHSALGVRRPDGTEVVFNFGTDVAQGVPHAPPEAPLLSLLLGRLHCFWILGDAAVERTIYAEQERSVVAQRLRLGPAATEALVARLEGLTEQPQEPIAFDWRHASCTSFIRDLIDEASGGALRASLSAPSPWTARQEVQRHLAPHWPGWFAFQLAAARADGPSSRYEAAFTPARLAGTLGTAMIPGPDGVEGTVAGPACLVNLGRSSVTAPSAPERNGLLAALGLLLAVPTLASARGRSARLLRASATGFLGLLGAGAGLATLGLWAVSATPGFGPNLNWLVANPLTLVLLPVALWQARGRPLPRLLVLGTLALATLGLLGLGVLLVAPGTQDSAGILALFLPLLLATAWRGLRS